MKKIMIVEDDVHIQDIFKIIFEMYGYEVECLERSEPLLARNSGLPDAIILDKQLPGINGITACQHLKAQSLTKDIPVILVTASIGVQKAAIGAGADSFFEKPFDMQTLVKTVNMLIQKNQNRGVN